MTFGKTNNNEVNVKRMRYTGVVSEDAAVMPTSQKRDEITVEPRTVAERTFTEGKAAVTFTLDSEANRLMREEMDRVGARSFNENDGALNVIHSVFHTVKGEVAENKRPFWGNVVMVSIFAVLLCIFAATCSEYNAAYSRQKTMETQIENYKTEQKKLKMAIEERDNFSDEMEDYVVNVLGMVKEESLTKHYVCSASTDVVTIRDGGDSGVGAGGVLLSGFKSIVSKVFFESED